MNINVIYYYNLLWNKVIYFLTCTEIEKNDSMFLLHYAKKKSVCDIRAKITFFKQKYPMFSHASKLEKGASQAGGPQNL